jgi:long-chain fatty acid transport protein
MIPFFGYTRLIDNQLAWGVGMCSTLGIGFKYRGDPAHGISRNFQNLTGVMVLSPTLAYQLHPKLAVGGQINIGYGKSQMDFPTPFGYLKNDSDGFGWGGSIGILYKPFTNLSIGIRWKSSMLTSLKGDVDLLTLGGKEKDDEVDLDLYWPQMVDVGIGYKLTSKLTLAAKVKWTDWSYFGRSKFHYDSMKCFNRPLVPEIRDGIRWGVGMEYMPTPKITLRSGYFHDDWSIETSSLSPLAPELTIREVRIGLAIKLGNWEVDTAYAYCFFRSRESLGPFPGKYEGFMPVISAGLTYHFH